MAFDESVALTPKLAEIVSPQAPSGELDGALAVPLPPELTGKSGLHVHETLETTPTVKFNDVGDYMIGAYAGFRVLQITGKEGVRDQRLYDIKTPSGIVVSVWGSKILDGRMDAAIKAGLGVNRSIMIQYLGDIDTGMPSEAHNYRVVWK